MVLVSIEQASCTHLYSTVDFFGILVDFAGIIVDFVGILIFRVSRLLSLVTKFVYSAFVRQAICRFCRYSFF